MVKNFPKLTTWTEPQIYDAQRILSMINTKAHRTQTEEN